LNGGLNTYRYVNSNPLNFIDPSGLLLGSALSKILGPIFKATKEEAAYSGQVLDVIIGAIAGDVVPDCVDGEDMRVPLNLLRGFGGVSSV
jgi:hypothetical protein